MMRANGRFGAQELDFEFRPSRLGQRRSAAFGISKGVSNRRWRASRSVSYTGKWLRTIKAKAVTPGRAQRLNTAGASQRSRL